MPIQISAEVQIAAPPERVWAVLADLPSYRQWHPVFLAVNGELAAGSKLTITTTQPTSGRTMNATVTVRTVEPCTELRWVSKMAGLPISDRRFLLSPSSGGTLLVQAGTYRGLGGGRGRGTAKSIGRIQDAYAAINQAIKQQAESLPDLPEGRHDRALPGHRPGAHHAGHPSPRRDPRQHRARLAPDQGRVVAVQPGSSRAAHRHP